MGDIALNLPGVHINIPFNTYNKRITLPERNECGRSKDQLQRSEFCDFRPGYTESFDALNNGQYNGFLPQAPTGVAALNSVVLHGYT